MHFAVAAVAPFLFRKFGRNTFYFLACIACLVAEWGLRRVNGLA